MTMQKRQTCWLFRSVFAIAVPKNWYSNISRYLLLWHTASISSFVSSCVSSSTYIFFHVFNFSVSTVSVCPVKVEDCTKISFFISMLLQQHQSLGNLPIPFEEIGKEILNFIVLIPFDLNLNYTRTTQIVHINLHLSSVLTFSENYVENHNISRYDCIVTHASWCISYCQVFANTCPSKKAVFEVNHFHAINIQKQS